MTKAVPKTHVNGIDWVVIKFKLGVFMPKVQAGNLRNGEKSLAGASNQSFWLNGCRWQLFDFENAEVFVNRLVRNHLLMFDSSVTAALRDEPPEMSPRTLRHHFLQTTGISQGKIRQIEQARRAMSLLEQGNSILDTVFMAGYADQPHLTRSLKRYMGYTPTQIAGLKRPL